MKRGFTLIEILVVIAIIGLLSSIVLSSLNSARKNARDAQRMRSVNELQKALDIYFSVNGRYPVSLNCGATEPNTHWCNSVETVTGTHWIEDSTATGVLAPYLKSEPTESRQPTTLALYDVYSNGKGIFYYSPSGGNWYMLIFGLEGFNSSIEKGGGVRDCAATRYDYRDPDLNGVVNYPGIVTIGRSCL